MITDKRVVKTRKSIKNALMELVEERDISKISVSDLAAKALINRSTFYLHYADVSEVAADIEKEMANNLASYIDNFLVDDIYASIYSLFLQLFNRLNENERIKRYIIYSTCSNRIIARLKEIFVKNAMDLIVKTTGVSEKDILYPLTYAASGIIDCYVKWVRDDDNSLSLSDVMEKISKITQYIIENSNEHNP